MVERIVYYLFDTSINRSIDAYNKNPLVERQQYQFDTDKSNGISYSEL